MAEFRYGCTFSNDGMEQNTRLQLSLEAVAEHLGFGKNVDDYIAALVALGPKIMNKEACDEWRELYV